MLKPRTPETTPRIASVATAVPPFPIGQDEVVDFIERHFLGDSHHLQLLRSVCVNAEISTRYASAPIEWYETEHGWQQKNEVFIEVSLSLFKRAATEAVEAAGLQFSDIDAIVSVSSTGISVPSLEARLMNELPFRRDIQRVPMMGLGCAGGALGLARAATIARAYPGSNVLLLVVELCTIMLNVRDLSVANIVATSLFGDGAAASVVSTDRTGPAIIDSTEYVWPNTTDILGWQVIDSGLGVVMSAKIPSMVRKHIRGFTERFLALHDLRLGDLDDLLLPSGRSQGAGRA